MSDAVEGCVPDGPASPVCARRPPLRGELDGAVRSLSDLPEDRLPVARARGRRWIGGARGACRSWPSRLPPLDYPAPYEVRLVSRNGGIRWHAQWVNVSHVLAEQHVGLEEVDDGEWDLYFGPLKLGRFHERLLRVEDALSRLRRRRQLPMSPD